MSFCVQDKIEFLTLRSVSSGPIRLNMARTKKKNLTNDHHEYTKESSDKYRTDNETWKARPWFANFDTPK